MSRPATFPDGSLLCSCLALALALSLSFNWDFFGPRSADPDPNVKNGALLLDRLVKDIVAESTEHRAQRAQSTSGPAAPIPREAMLKEKDMPQHGDHGVGSTLTPMTPMFITLLVKNMAREERDPNPFIRQFLLGWITDHRLDSFWITDLTKSERFPEVLDRLFDVLVDPNKEIRQQAVSALSGLVQGVPCWRETVSRKTELTWSPTGLVLGALLPSVLRHAKSADELTRGVAAEWLTAIVEALTLSGGEGCRMLDQHGKLPLQLALEHGAAADVVGKIHQAFPLQNWRKGGWTLLDAVTVVAVAKSSDRFGPTFSDLVIELMTVEACRETDRRGRLPLHLAISHSAPSSVVLSLIQVLPEACCVEDADGKLPLQHAIERAQMWTQQMHPDVLIALIGVHPGSATLVRELNFSGMQMDDAKAAQLIATLATAGSNRQSLAYLNLSRNELTKFPAGIGAISSLETLDLRDNAITHLPIEVLQLTKLTGLEVAGNPRLQPAVEIGQADGVAGILAYVQDLYDDPQPSFSLKLMLAGPTMAGKSSLLRALLRKPVTLTTVDERTIGLDIERLVLEDSRTPDGVRFLIYDAGGHDEYQEMHQPFVTKDTLYLLLWDMSHPRSGDDAFAVTEDIVRSLAQWATLIQTCAPGSTVLLIGSHADEVDDRALIDQRCLYMQQRVCAELEKYRSVQLVEHERLSAAQQSSPAAVARFEQLSQVLDTPLRIAGCHAVSAKTLLGLDTLRERLVELAFDKTKFPSFGDVQPGTYTMVHRHLMRAFPETLAVTWQQIQEWSLHPPDLTQEKIHVQSGGSNLVRRATGGDAFREYKFLVCILGESVKGFTVRYSHAQKCHARLKKAISGLGSVHFPFNRADAARDMVQNEANVARRGEELRVYYQQLFDKHDVLALQAFEDIAPDGFGIASLHLQYCAPFRKARDDPQLIRRAILYLRITGEVLWHDCEHMPMLQERVFLKPQLLVDVMKELVRHDLGERVEAIDPAMPHAIDVQTHGRRFVKDGQLVGPSHSPVLPWLWRDLKPSVSDDPAQMDFLIELLTQHGLLTRLPRTDPPCWLLPMRLPQIAILRLPRTLMGVVTTTASRRPSRPVSNEPQPESATDAMEERPIAGAKTARVAASVVVQSEVAGVVGGAMIALGKAGVAAVTFGLAAATVGTVGTVVVGVATTAALTSKAVGWNALKQAPHTSVGTPGGQIRKGGMLKCIAGSKGLGGQLNDLGIAVVGLEPHDGLIYAHCISFTVWKPGQYSFTDASDATYSKVCQVGGRFRIAFNSPDPTITRVSSNADRTVVQYSVLPTTDATANTSSHQAKDADFDRDSVDIDESEVEEDGDEVARLHEFHQPLPSGLIAVMISRCAKACGPKTQIWRQALHTTLTVSGLPIIELMVCVDGLSRIVIWARCPAGGRHHVLLDKVALFEDIVQSVVIEQWPGCTSSVSCFVPGSDNPVVVPLSLCELALARAETSVIVDGTHVQLSTIMRGLPPPMSATVVGQLAMLRFFRAVPAALGDLIDLPLVKAFVTEMDAELLVHMDGQPWSAMLCNARDTSGLLDADALRAVEESAGRDGESQALSLLAVLGRLHDNSHILRDAFSSLEALCEHIFASFAWLGPALLNLAAVHKLEQLPALASLFENVMAEVAVAAPAAAWSSEPEPEG